MKNLLTLKPNIYLSKINLYLPIPGVLVVHLLPSTENLLIFLLKNLLMGIFLFPLIPEKRKFLSQKEELYLTIVFKIKEKLLELNLLCGLTLLKQKNLIQNLWPRKSQSRLLILPDTPTFSKLILKMKLPHYFVDPPELENHSISKIYLINLMIPKYQSLNQDFQPKQLAVRHKKSLTLNLIEEEKESLDQNKVKESSLLMTLICPLKKNMELNLLLKFLDKNQTREDGTIIKIS